MKAPLISLGALLSALVLASGAAFGQAIIGPFSDATDVGHPSIPGFIFYDAARGACTVTGGGHDIWATNDEFFYVWTKVSGDVALAANIKFNPSTNAAPSPHRKAALMIRQSLDAGSPYVDAVLHGNGLVSLQARDFPARTSSEIEARFGAMPSPARLQIVKRSNYVEMNLADTGRPLEPSGASYKVTFQSPFYIGLAICAHRDLAHSATESAEFSEIEMSVPPPYSAPLPSHAASAIETVPVYGNRQIACFTPRHIESLNWSRDGKFFIFDQNFKLYQMPTNGEPVPIETGGLSRIGSDHGLSPDGNWLALSDHTLPGGARIYVVPIGGGVPRLLTSNAPSYFHSWSPDGKTIAFSGQRNGTFDIFTIPVKGGPETQLTHDASRDDAPEFSADGSKIYFSSDRTGHMQIWRMDADGSNPEQVTSDDYVNTFPHPSPDGRALAYLAFPPAANPSHSSLDDIQLRLLSLNGGTLRTLGRFYGNEGSLNTPSWSPDGLRIALVSYLPW